MVVFCYGFKVFRIDLTIKKLQAGDRVDASLSEIDDARYASASDYHFYKELRELAARINLQKNCIKKVIDKTVNRSIPVNHRCSLQ